MPSEELKSAEAYLIRLHIGLEDVNDVIADLQQAYARALPSLARGFCSSKSRKKAGAPLMVAPDCIN